MRCLSQAHAIAARLNCLYALQAAIPKPTRSALHRLFQRHAISRLPAIDGDKPKKRFKEYAIGYFHIGIAELRTGEGKLHMFVAIDRTSKFAFVELNDKANRKTAATFLESLIMAVPYKIHSVLTGNGVQFCHMPQHRDGPTAQYGAHMFDRVCRENDIEHRLTRPNHPWTNGQVERMNRTLKEATVRRYHYDTNARLREHLAAFIAAYNFAKRLKTLNGLTPYDDILKCWTEDLNRFILDPTHHSAGLNTSATANGVAAVAVDSPMRISKTVGRAVRRKGLGHRLWHRGGIGLS